MLKKFYDLSSRCTVILPPMVSVLWSIKGWYVSIVIYNHRPFIRLVTHIVYKDLLYSANFPSTECDLIWLIFPTLAKFYKSLAILRGLFSIWPV